MSAKQPLWLRAVYRLERAVGERVESAVRSEPYFDAVAEFTRLRNKAIGAVEGVSRRCLHLLNLPAGTDIRRIRQQLARMERRLNELNDQVSEMEDDAQPPPRVRSPNATGSGSH